MAENPYLPPDDASNPYAAPDADLSVGPHHMPILPGSGEFSIGEVIGRAWELYKQRFGVVFGVCMIALGINYAWQFGSSFIVNGIGPDTAAGLFTQLGMAVVGLALQMWLTAGQSYALLKVAKGLDAQVGDVFQGGPWVLRIFGASILVGLVVIGIIVACLVPFGIVFAATSGDAQAVRIGAGVIAVVAAVGALLVVTARLSQFMYLIIDREAGVVESIKGSMTITEGHTVELIGLFIVTGFISASGILLLCIGVIFTIPLGMLIYLCTYTALVGESGKPVKLDPLGDPDFPEFAQ